MAHPHHHHAPSPHARQQRPARSGDQPAWAPFVDRYGRKVYPHHWQAFWLTAVEGLTAEEAAGRLGMKVARVYSARNRVQLRVQEERRHLEGGYRPA